MVAAVLVFRGKGGIDILSCKFGVVGWNIKLESDRFKIVLI